MKIVMMDAEKLAEKYSRVYADMLWNGVDPKGWAWEEIRRDSNAGFLAGFAAGREAGMERAAQLANGIRMEQLGDFEAAQIQRVIDLIHAEVEK